MEIIGDSAFERCNNLASIYIPRSVTSIDDDAFYDCKGLETVYYEGTKEEWENIEIGSYNRNLKNAEIIFNASSDDIDTPVEDDVTPPDDGLTPPEGFVFFEKHGIAVVHPEGWTDIGYAIHGLTGESIMISYTLESIEGFYTEMTVEKYEYIITGGGVHTSYSDISVTYILPEYSQYVITRCSAREGSIWITQIFIAGNDNVVRYITIGGIGEAHAEFVDTIIANLVIKDYTD